MALLWAKKAYEQHLRLGDEEKAHTDDFAVITELEAVLKTGVPANPREFPFPDCY
jgi:hypothetical protein